MLALAFVACTNGAKSPRPDEHGATASAESYDAPRAAMVEHVRGYGMADERVLAAMRKTPRHLFVPEGQVKHAYEDTALPIGHDQTISQPSVVALMTELLHVRPGDKVLEVGTGSGYQAAILAEVGAEIYSIEIVKPLADEAAERLARMGYSKIHVRAGDGYEGWPEHAPFDGVIVTCAPDHIPQPLIDQLKPGGRICIPVGAAFGEQTLYLKTKLQSGGLRTEMSVPVRFVPLTGAHGAKR